MDKKTTIGLVLPSLPGYSETFFRSKINGLLANNFNVIVFVNKKNKKIKLPCKIVYAPDFSKKNLIFSILRCLKNIFLNLSRSKKLLVINLKDKFNIKQSIKNVFINSHFLKYNLDCLHFGFGTMAIDRENIAEAINAKMAVSFRGFDHYVYPSKNMNCYDFLFKKNVKYHVLSNGMKKTLIEKEIDNFKIEKITPAIDINLFNENFLINSGDIHLITIARLHWIKGIEYTLEALALVKNLGFDFKYTIIGDGPEKERLQFAAHQLGLTENIFFTGKLEPSAVKEKLQTASIYLQYSIQEGFCNAVLEAQAMGKICIVSDAEGLQENIIDGITGFIVQKRKPKDLSEKIIEIIKLDQLSINKIKSNAIERVQNEFTIEKQIEKFISFYQN
jgi:colanic acid/amylovoran biosynthesis glycosyltransferase